MKHFTRTLLGLTILLAAAACGDKDGPSVVSTRVGNVTVTPDSVALIPGGTQLFTAELKDVNWNVVTGRMIRWSVANTGVATIDSLTGQLTAVSEGVTEVRAYSELQTGRAKVVVMPEPVRR